MSDNAPCNVGVMFPGRPVADMACTMASIGALGAGNSGAVGTTDVVDTSGSIVVVVLRMVGAVAATPPFIVGGLFRASTALPPTIEMRETANTKAFTPRIDLFRRMGFSTMRYDSSDKAREIPRHTNPSTTVSSFSNAAAPTMRTGQCHKYAEYERDPNHCKGDTLSNSRGDHDVASPPYNKTAVARTGTMAHGPGNLVESVKRRTEPITPTRPHQATSVANVRAAFPCAIGSTANNAPSDNSKARVCGEKNAQG
ncbi:unannotated protein [freshwater metagenome]|uniref:Unannotated protein n=1 Tax=freshwater metagenome TaxID=449393 RepID=A0A6J6HLC5_9ZZZZ